MLRDVAGTAALSDNGFRHSAKSCTLLLVTSLRLSRTMLTRDCGLRSVRLVRPTAKLGSARSGEPNKRNAETAFRPWGGCELRLAEQAENTFYIKVIPSEAEHLNPTCEAA